MPPFTKFSFTSEGQGNPKKLIYAPDMSLSTKAIIHYSLKASVFMASICIFYLRYYMVFHLTIMLTSKTAHMINNRGDKLRVLLPAIQNFSADASGSPYLQQKYSVSLASCVMFEINNKQRISRTIFSHNRISNARLVLCKATS